MNNLRYFLLIVLILGVLNGAQAQDACPFDKHLYQDEQQLMPDLSDFLAGKRYILPEGMKLKGYNEFKYDPMLLKKILMKEEYNLEDYTTNMNDNEKAFISWIIFYTKNRTSDNYQLMPLSIPYELGMDWRMRGQKSQRPNDKVQVEFSVRKASVFKKEMSTALKISEDSVFVSPKEFVENFYDLIKGIEYSDFSKFNEYRAEMFYSFGECLTILGLKHNAFRAYNQSADLTKNADLHELAVTAAREIQTSQRADFDKFEDDFLNTQKEEAQKFNVAFTKFAGEHKEITDFSAMKKTFLEDYGKQNSTVIILLGIFGVLILAILIFITKKKVG